MTPSFLRFAGAAFRLTLGVVTALIVTGSFYWVLSRPFRAAAERAGQIELTVMHWGSKDESDIVKGLLEDFLATHPNIKINRINPGGGDQYATKLQTTMAAGTMPDVFYVGSERFAVYAATGQLMNLDPYLEADRGAGQGDLLADFYEPVLDAFRFDGKRAGRGAVYGLPKDFTTVGFYYNRDLFRKAGVPEPNGEWTWDDWLAAARAIASLDGCYGCELVQWEAMIRCYLWTQGVDIVTCDFDRILADDPGALAGLERMRSWRFGPGNERVLTRAVFANQTSSDMFITGNVGLNGPLGRWMVPVFRRIEAFDWDFAPLPRAKDKPPANVIFTTAWCISRHTRHPQEAWELIRHLCGPEGQALNSRFGLAIPAIRSVAESDAFRDPDQKPERDQVYLDSVPYARPIDWPLYPEFQSLVNTYMSEALNKSTGSVAGALNGLALVWAAHQSAPLRRTDFPRMPWRTIATSAGVPLALLVLAAAAWWWFRRPTRLDFREELAGLSMVSPWVIGFVAFTLFPIVLSLLLAFTKWNGIVTLDHAQWVGLGNLQEQLFHVARFRKSIVATAYYAALAVPLGQIAALIAAFLMDHEFRGIRFFRAAWYLPSVLAGVGVAVLWRWMFDNQTGLVNLALAPLLRPLGLAPPDWFGNDAETWAVPAFTLMSLWTIGAGMMIYLAGLKGIPGELREAAAIDGAGRLRQMWNVTLPMLSPVIFFNVIMAIIGSFQTFVQSYVMTGGEPRDTTRFFVLYLYNQAFDFHEMGYASMMAWMLLIITLALTLLIMRGSRRFVYYEALKA